MDEFANDRKIDAVVSDEALVASGGVCGPVAVDYSLTTVGVADRPMISAAAQFGASRDGLRFILPHTFASVMTDGPASVWTEANDIALDDPATKPHATFACQSVQEYYVDAVTSIVQFGNFQARYFPEQIQEYMQTVDAVHARVAESNLLSTLHAGSAQTTADTYELGASREALAVLDRAVSAYRNRNRMRPNSPLRLVAPAFLRDMIRADLARQLPGDSGGQAERLAVTDAQIDAFFAARNVNLTEVLDSYTGTTDYGATAGYQGFPSVQGAGQLSPWPTKTTLWLYHEGAWMFLDGGELNLGMVRDSTLNRTNDFQMFSETFEKLVFRGHESVEITLEIDPTAASAAAVAPDFTVGS